MIKSVLCPNPGRGKIERRMRARAIGACFACAFRTGALRNREEGCLFSPVGSYSSCGFW